MAFFLKGRVNRADESDWVLEMLGQNSVDSHLEPGEEPSESQSLPGIESDQSEGELTPQKPELSFAEDTGSVTDEGDSIDSPGKDSKSELGQPSLRARPSFPHLRVKSFPEVCPLCGGRVPPEGQATDLQARMSLFLQKFGPAIGWIDLPAGFLLSVIIPVYNERATIRELVARVEAVPIPKEIILVDDGSTDGTREILEGWQGRPGFQILFHERNRGKGAAIRTGLAAARGDVVLIQDADLEYDPVHYPELIFPIVSGVADVVYGSRFLPAGPHRVLYFWHAVANWIITTLSNMFTDLNLTDVETCYKVFRGDLIRSIAPTLREEGFGFEIEVTAKVARRRCRIYEVGISYFGRTYTEGKKIRLRDAFHAVWCILRYWRWD